MNLSLCLVLVPIVRFGTNRLFWYRWCVLVLIVYFGTNYLFLHRSFILVPFTHSSTNTPHLSWFNNTDETRIFWSFSPTMEPPFTQRISHLEGSIHISMNKGFELGAQLEYRMWAHLNGGISINTKETCLNEFLRFLRQLEGELL